MNPLWLLYLLLGISLIATIVAQVGRRRLQSQLRGLARSLQLHFSPRDHARLAVRVAPLLPTPGAAAVRVTNLIFGQTESVYRYIFTAEYTVGVLKLKHRDQCVACLTEQKNPQPGHDSLRLMIAPIKGTIFEQYQALAPQVNAPLDASAGGN